MDCSAALNVPVCEFKVIQFYRLTLRDNQEFLEWYCCEPIRIGLAADVAWKVYQERKKSLTSENQDELSMDSILKMLWLSSKKKMDMSLFTKDDYEHLIKILKEVMTVNPTVTGVK